MRKKPASPGTGPNHPRALRIVCSYTGSEIRLVSQESIEMTPPPSDALDVREGESGFWYEVRDADDRPRYRRIVQNPIRFAAEIRTDDAARPLAWQDVQEPRGEFVVVIPDRLDARFLVLFSSPLSGRAAGSAAREIARVDLSNDRRSRETS